MVLNLCRMFHCTPSQLEKEEAEIIRLMNIVILGSREQQLGEGEFGG